MNPTTKPGEADLTALREKFEAWFCEDGNYEPEWLDWNRAGMYSNADTQNMFEAFQAGAALGTAPATPVPASEPVAWMFTLRHPQPRPRLETFAAIDWVPGVDEKRVLVSKEPLYTTPTSPAPAPATQASPQTVKNHTPD